MATEHIDLLRGLPPADHEAILGSARVISLAPGEVLFSLGAEADCLYVIRRGRIGLSLPMQIEGRDQDIVIEEHVPGQTLGWSALVPPHRFTMKGVAAIATEVRAIRREDLLAYCDAHPDAGFLVGINIASIIGHRLQVFQAMWLRQMQQAVSRAHV